LEDFTDAFVDLLEASLFAPVFAADAERAVARARCAERAELASLSLLVVVFSLAVGIPFFFLAS
jgi:hypothetical protein